MDDVALMKLYEAVRAGKKPTVRDLPDDKRRAYMREAQRRSRSADRITGTGTVTASVKREALADAALAVLATDAEGADSIRRVLGTIFVAKPAVALRIAAEAKSGRLRPKHLKS